MDGTPIHAVFITSMKGTIYTGETRFTSGELVTSADTELSSLTDLRGGKNRNKALVIDSESLSTGRFNPPVVDGVRIPGCDVWLTESIRDIGDLTDAFLGNMRKLVIPTHSLGKGLSVREINDISDSCIPMVCFADGHTLDGKDLLRDVAEAFDAGYPNVILFDMDSTVDQSDMQYLCGNHPGLCVLSPVKAVEHAGITFETIGNYSISR